MQTYIVYVLQSEIDTDTNYTNLYFAVLVILA